VDFEGQRGKKVLDVGCGAGVDAVRFARAGALVTAVDIAPAAIDLAASNFRYQQLSAELVTADAEHLPFPNGAFDYVFAHGVVQYTADDQALVDECRRVLRPGGVAVFQVYNRISWLNLLSKVMKVGLEHEDAPVLRKYSAGEFRRLLAGFAAVRLVPERFPVKSRLHKGWKGAVYNTVFVGTFNALPRPLVRRFGWHLLAFCGR
jgi:ubiquinone/menaquinone biosynthesis C-methylase UbiE